MKTVRIWLERGKIGPADCLLHGVGVQEWMKPCIIDRPGGTGDRLFMYFYENVLIKDAGGEVREFMPGTMVLWTPDSGHYYGHESGRWRHSWLHCDGDFITNILEREKLPLNTPFYTPDSALWEKYLLDLYSEVTGHAQPDELIIRNTVENFLHELARSLYPEASVRLPENFRRLKKLLDEDFASPRTLADMAGEVHLSASHFSAEFRRLFGVSPVEYLIRSRLRHASYLLRDRNLSVGEVASRVGYDDIYYFSKLFKKHFGYPPSTFRGKRS